MTGRNAAVRLLEESKEASRQGDYLRSYDLATQGIELDKENIWLKHQAVLSLARSGAIDEAYDRYRAFGLADNEHEDIAALGARLEKDIALSVKSDAQAGLLQSAAGKYETIFNKTGGYYPGINAATLHYLSGSANKSKKLAQHVQETCQRKLSESGIDDYYLRATLAEGYLLLGNEIAASEQLQRAAILGQQNFGEVATTRKQLKLILEKSGNDITLLDSLSLPGVISFSGLSSTNAQLEQSQLSSSEAQLRRAISKVLRESNVGFGFGVPNPGAGITIAEELIVKNAELHLVLPFSIDEYKSLFIEQADKKWLNRLERCVENSKSITMATEDNYLGDNLLFSYANQFAMGLALLRARILDTTIEHVSVWEESGNDDLLDNTNDIGKWLSLGLPLELFGFNGKKQTSIPEYLRAQDSKQTKGLREPRAMLFGDVKGFSRLREAQLTLFIDTILKSIGEALDEFEGDILFTNTWGDGLFVVFRSVDRAAKCAIEIQKALKSLDLVSAGLPEDMFIRIGGHFGPIFQAFDPILKKTNYFGAHVSRTARIEPVTPPGEVYVTESFAAQLILMKDSEFQTEYVGNIPAAKSYGNLKMYVLKTH